MVKIGLIREGKVPADNRVPLTPDQCKWIRNNYPDVEVVVQHSEVRCFSDHEYELAGIPVTDDVKDCHILLGIKEVPIGQLIPGKTYLFFSHTKKAQPHNRKLLQTILEKNITLIDYECLEHEDGQRMIGFGFFAGVVGAHNGMMAYGKRTGLFNLPRVYQQQSFRELIHSYFGIRLPAIKIAVTGSGRVAHGVLEVMNLMGIHEVEPEDFRLRQFTYPVYTQLKGADLYEHQQNGSYHRQHFHEHPGQYHCKFSPYTSCTNILMNGVYWDKGIPRLFEAADVSHPNFLISTISDITDDAGGSVPINLGDQSIEDPIYGVDRKTLRKTAPYVEGSIDIVAVSNLPNELPRDASRYFGEQLIKFVLEGLLTGKSAPIQKATLTDKGKLTPGYSYLHSFVSG